MKRSILTTDEKSEFGDVQPALEIVQLLPSNTVTTPEGAVRIHRPTTTLVVLLSAEASLAPDLLALSTDSVILIPAAYPCELRSRSSQPIELAAIDLSFRFRGLDVSIALPKEPVVISCSEADTMKQDICSVCSLPTGEWNMIQTADRMAAAYRIASGLTRVLARIFLSALLPNR